MHGRTSKALGTVETSTHSRQAKAPLNEALGTVAASKQPSTQALPTTRRASLCDLSVFA